MALPRGSRIPRAGAALALGLLSPALGLGDARASDAEALAKQLANPVASLISVPFDADYDHDLGPFDDGERVTLVAKPVVPFPLGDDWNLITRTIVPFVHLRDLAPGVNDQSGLGDVQASFFLSPTAPTAGWIWGAGPIVLLPTATDTLLGSDKWGAGPTAVALRQEGPWTFGALANHVWSFAGDHDRPAFDRTFLQPFLVYTTRKATSFTLQTESSYDWKADAWTVPVNLLVAQVLRIGPQLLQLRAGVRYWAETPTNTGPEGFGARVGVTLLYPR